jgi:tRNA A-37 threonylcarbamoyl transferase component Bud32
MTHDEQNCERSPQLEVPSQPARQPDLVGATDDFGLTPKPRAKARLVDPLLGTDLGGVKIVQLLGEGGMGRVYEAVQDRPERTVAVKVIRQGITSERTLRRFEREAEFLAKLQHPGIAQIYIVGTYSSDYGDVPFYVMEFIADAKPITNYCFDNQIPLRERLGVFADICDAVSHGHDRGIVHRDLKPGNILVDGHGNPRVIDFGVARSTDSDLTLTSMKTDSGNLVGTAQYMSPEQFGAKSDDLDPRADVYSLGVVLYELLAGVLPYEFQRKGLHEIARLVCEVAPRPLRGLDKAIPWDVAAIVHKCLEKDRRDRYHSAGDLVTDLRRYLDGKPVRAGAGHFASLRRLRAIVPRSRPGKVLGSLLLAATLVIAITAASRAIVSSLPITKQLMVTSDWADTGLSVEKDRCYRLTVTGSCHDTAGASFGPDGTCPVLFRTVLGPVKDLPLKTRNQCYVGQHPIRAVIVRIGDKAWSIHVGPELKFLAPASGPVSVRINEPKNSPHRPEGELRLSLEPIPRPKLVDDKGRTTIWAHVDDSDYLLLTPEGLQWEYGGRWARVGMHEGVFPTLVNGMAWWPDWTDPVRSSVLKTDEFKAAAAGKQSIKVVNVVARHGLVEAETPYDGMVRVRLHDTELGSGDIGCTLVFSGSLSMGLRPSGLSPPPEALLAHDLDTACETLAAKKAIEGLARGGIAFLPPKGNGRSGARGIALPAPKDWNTAGSCWTFDYVARETAQGFQIIHPHKQGHVVTTLTRRKKNVTVVAGGSWTAIGWDGGQSLRVTREAEFEEAIVRRNWEIDAQIDSVLAADGRYELRINGKRILGAEVPNATLFKFSEDFDRGDLPEQLPLGYAMLIVGPTDGPDENRISHARIGYAR